MASDENMSQSLFNKFIEYVDTGLFNDNWVPIYSEIRTPDSDGILHAVMISKARATEAMLNASWDIHLEGGYPGFSVSYLNGEKQVIYQNSFEEGFERLILFRNFYRRRPDFIELSEEFRLFHNLFLVEKKGIQYCTYDDNGDEIDVVKISNNKVIVRKGFLQSYLAAKQMDFVMNFELTKHHDLVDSYSEDIVSESLTYTIYSNKGYKEPYQSFSRILGKKLINCLPIESAGRWPFEKEKLYEDFMIGGEPDTPIFYSCNPDKLSNYFGANKGAPHYLTPVFFDNKVMQLYYSSSEYEINDGMIARMGVWSLYVDNNTENHISVFLGDLGTYLPNKEQQYWKRFNLVPDDKEISKANFERSFLGNFSSTLNPSLVFKQTFESFQNSWVKRHGWPLFLPLLDRDEHYFTSLRSMLSNEQSEFDQMLMCLVKVTIDSINICQLNEMLGPSIDGSKSISLLKILFERICLNDIEEKIKIIRNIQSLRSEGVAHRKGSNYKKTTLKMSLNFEDLKSVLDSYYVFFSTLFDEIQKC